MRRTLIATLVVLSCGHAGADVQNLEQFLRGVEETTTVAVPLRADGQLEVTTPEGSRRTAIVQIVRPPADTYMEFQQTHTKVLLPSNPGKGFVLKKDATKAEELAADSSVADSDFIAEDLEPFRLSQYKDWRITDETAAEMTVTLFPKSPQYSLVVVTFDREKKVPLKTLYYKETLNNLVKMRRDADYVLIGRKWVPTTTSMETFKLRTHSTFTLRWTQNPTFPPELFDPVFLPHASGIVWPTTTP